MGEQWYKKWLSIMKPQKAKFKTFYQEPIYPAEFRVQKRFAIVLPYPPYMPVMLTGWVQHEVHIQFGYQSLQ